MSAQTQQQAEIAVAELRSYIALYDGVDPAPGSHTALQLDAARQAVAAYDAVQQHLVPKTD
jgi:hypothetical protein